MRSWIPQLLAGAAAGAAMLPLSCGGKESTAPPPQVAAVVITSPSAAPSFAALGRTVQFTAEARDASGRAVPGQTIVWTSSNPAVATISGAGLATAVGNGTDTIRASVGSIAAALPLTVAQVASQVAVAPAAVTLAALGATQQLTATAKDSGGAAVPGATVAWSATAHGAATVTGGGLVTAVTNGADTVTATAAAASGRVPVTVQQAVATIGVTPAAATLSTQGRTRQFAASAADARGNTIGGTKFTWASTNTAVATVDTTGLATAQNNGTIQVRASAGGQTGSASLTVSRVVVSASVQSANLRKLDTLRTLGGTLVYTGAATDSSGATIGGQSFSWVSRQTAVAGVSPASGASTTATAQGNGTTTIVGTAGAVSDSATLVVNATLPAAAAVNVGNNFFTSVRNGTSNPAVDTIAAGGTVTWTWQETGVNHTVQSTGTPSFASSGILNTTGAAYSVTFAAAGTYAYDCAIHGALMTGTVVVK